MRNVGRGFALVMLLCAAGCATPSQDASQAVDATIVTLPQAVHFQSLEGADLVVEAGTYRVERAALEGLTLTAVDTTGMATVKTGQTTHDFKLRGPLALVAPEGDDTRHIALLLPGGEALDASGSLSGIQSRAASSPTISRMALQQSVQVLRPAQLTLFAMPPPDPCAGAIPPAPVMTAPILLKPLAPNLTNKQFMRQSVAPQEFGPDPIPDVVDWQPKQKVPAGRQLIIQGRSLDPSRFVAKIGEIVLPMATQSSSEIRLTIPADLRAVGMPLVVYHRGGTPRTLEPSYEVFDPASKITRVVPETFSQGDLVTICGVSVSHLRLSESVRTNAGGSGVPQYETRTLALIGTPNGQYQTYHYVDLINPIASSSGDRLTFVVGTSLYKEVFRAATPDGKAAYTDIVQDPAPSNPVTGPLSFHSETNPTNSRDVFAPNPVTWRLGGPKIAKVGMHPNAQFGLGEPFFMQPTILPNNTMYPGYGVGRMFVVEGSNLVGQYRIGTVPVPQLSLLSSDETKVGVVPPPTVFGGELCGTKNGVIGCGPTPVTVVPGPVLASLPNFPLALRVTHTINGLHLRPSGVAGLTYELFVSGLMNPSQQIAGGSAPTIGQCNMALQVLEHTDSRIQFRFGDPAGPAPNSSCMTFLANYFNAASPSRPTMFLLGKYSGKQLTVWHQQFHLTQ